MTIPTIGKQWEFRPQHKCPWLPWENIILSSTLRAEVETPVAGSLAERPRSLLHGAWMKTGSGTQHRKTPTARKHEICFPLQLDLLFKLRSAQSKDRWPSKTTGHQWAFRFFHLVVSGLFANFPKSLKAKFSSWGSTSCLQCEWWHDMNIHEPNLKDIRIHEPLKPWKIKVLAT